MIVKLIEKSLEVVIKESYDEWRMNKEPQQNEGQKTDSMSCYVDGEINKNWE